jgi:hypothetical protein
MKTTSTVIFILIFIFSIQSLFSQNISDIQKFSEKMNSYLESISKEGQVRSYKIMCIRKIVVKGTIENDNKIFKQEIKIYKSGLKREETHIYGKAMGMKFLIADIIRINETLFYAKYYETKMIKKKNVRMSEESIVNQKIYFKRELE